ncbi:MAG: GNAT family N-acetyltransferase [Clostridia bacterium]|nr:GNAT family N-acetyltransferase [Clostridia bacterium]
MDHAKAALIEREIILLEKEHRGQVLEILPKAFSEDPMFRYLFTGESRNKYLRNFFNFIYYKSILLREMPIGVSDSGVLKGVASIELPTGIKGAGLLLKPSFIYHGIKLFFQIPKKSFAFINQYMQFTTSMRPKAPHHYLVFVGVDPDHQGKGVGKMLLTHIHRLVDQDPTSTGIGLDTENPENVALYERFGYKVIGSRKIGDITVYCMFRPRL